MIGDSIVNSAMQRALDGVWERQRSITTNLSNYDTPEYKARVVNFEDELRKEVLKIQETAHTRSEIAARLGEVEKSRIDITKDPTISERMDGNNVNLDAESIELAKAQIQYMYLTNSMTNMYSRLKKAINGNG